MPFLICLILFASLLPGAGAAAAPFDPSASPRFRTEGIPLLAFATVAFTDEAKKAPPSPSSFGPAENVRVNLGYDTRTLWIRFDLQNASATPLGLILRLGNPTLDRVTLYMLQDGSRLPVAETGIMTPRPFADGIIEPHFYIEVPPHSIQAYLLRIHTESSALRLFPKLVSTNAFYKEAVHAQMFRSLFFGAMGALILYNFFIFLFTRENAYLYYSLYHTFAVINYLSYTSMINDFLPPSLWKLDAYLAVFYQNAGMFFLLLFARSFLDIKRHPKLDAIFRTLLAATGLLAVWGLLHPASFPIELSLLFALLIIVWVFATAWYFAFSHEANGKILAISWSFATFGFLALGLYDAGYPSPLNDFPTLYEWSVFAEAVLFSIALSKRLNLTQKLAAALERNTFLLSELNHRTKNNMQFISSLYRMKLAPFDAPGLSRSLQEAENAVWAIRAVHEMLYGDASSREVDMHRYVVRLADHLRDGANRPDVSFRFDIAMRCDGEEAIKIGTLLNELITNAFKHAFPSQTGKHRIEIALQATGNEATLRFADNGKGCDGKRGFGLRLVASIVENELGGEMVKLQMQGCGFLFRWPRKTENG